MGRKLAPYLVVSVFLAALTGCQDSDASGAQVDQKKMEANGVSTHAREPVVNPLAKPSRPGSKVGG